MRPRCPRAAAAHQRGISACGVIVVARLPQRRLSSNRRAKEVRNRADREGERGRYVVERIHAQRDRDLVDRLVALATVGVDGALPVAHKGRVGMHFDSPLSQLKGLLEAATEDSEGIGSGCNAGAVARSRGQGAGGCLAGIADLVLPARMPAVRNPAGHDVGEGAERLGIVGVDRNCPAESASA